MTNPERARLDEDREQKVAWKKWGPYLSERQWGTVREEGSLRGSKGKEVAPLGGANITGAAAAGAGLRR